MELNVIQEKGKQLPPWYGGGLRFTCSQCGNCCTGGPGYVWISKVEISRLAEHLKLTTAQVISRYCRKVGNCYSLKESRNSRGEYDCIFLKEEKVSSGKKGQTIVFTRRSCTVYPVRPLQCRTWPFWEGNLVSPEAWKRASQRCHGMNNGARVFGYDEIVALRDARDWPKRPPSSK
jgi:Fe-S-cluster containining protein